MTTFHVMILLPSFAFAFVALAALYDVRRAYLALSWVPAALCVLIQTFQRLSTFKPSPVNWPDLLPAVALTGLLQSLLGAALAAWSTWRGRGCAGLLFAACLAGAPYLIAGWRW